jgi:hypothetical protein
MLPEFNRCAKAISSGRTGSRASCPTQGLLAEMMTGVTPFADPLPFAADRFG